MDITENKTEDIISIGFISIVLVLMLVIHVTGAL